MRVTREKFAENREKILTAASVLFRENGFDGVGVADIMKAAGLTHGGFYGHFESKDDLALEVSRKLIERVEERWRELIVGHPDVRFRRCSIITSIGARSTIPVEAASLRR